jgi:hypothetical protein
MQVVFAFDGSPTDDNPDWVRVAGEVEALGGENLRIPHAELGQIAVFDLPDSTDVDDALDRLRSLDGVAAADLDATREATT